MAGARRLVAATLALACAVVLGACGSGGSATTAGGSDLTVAAAASLQRALTRYSESFSRTDGHGAVHLSFAGSDALAAQIESGLRPDVFASANTKLPATLYARGLLDRPVDFAANRLVIAVPAGASAVHTAADLARPGLTIAVGSPTVPIGAYTRTVLARLPPTIGRAVAANIRDEEPDVTGIMGKLTEHAVDAGVVYATDVRAAGGAVKAIPLPESLQPKVTYAAGVVKGTPDEAQARAFLQGLLSGEGRRDLEAAGFLPPP
jgi:molybdate transport system substrate-binding protein